jgi:PAS domain S-box-containing protein
LVEHSPLAVIEWDPEHRITKWMGHSEALFGWRATEVLGKRLDAFGLIHPEDLHIVWTALKDLEHGKNSVIVRNRNCRKDGAVIHCEWYNSAMIESPGELAWGLSLALDVTRRHEMEEVLRASERRLVSIYNTVEDVIFHLGVEADGQYRFLSVNAAFLRITELSAEAVIGKLVNEVIPEPSLTRVLTMYRQVVEERAIVRWEETSDYPSGRLTGEVTVAPVLDSHGNCTHLVGSVHDITERKEAQRALRESEEKYRNIFEAAPVGIFQAGPTCGLISANSRLAAMFGYDSPEELIRFTNEHCGVGLYADEGQHIEIVRRMRETVGYVHSEVGNARLSVEK